MAGKPLYSDLGAAPHNPIDPRHLDETFPVAHARVQTLPLFPYSLLSFVTISYFCIARRLLQDAVLCAIGLKFTNGSFKK